MDDSRLAPCVLIYDGDCDLCCTLVRGVRRWDRAGRILARPLQDERVLARAGISRAAAHKELQLVCPDGRRYAGADAVAHTLGLLPVGGVAGRLLRCAPIAPLAHQIYRWVAGHRSVIWRLVPGAFRPRKPCG